MAKKDTEEEWGTQGGDGPGRVDSNPDRTQQIDRYNWSRDSEIEEKTYILKDRKKG